MLVTSLKRSYTKWLFAIAGQVPVRKQLLLMNFYPSLYQFQLFGWEIARKNTPVVNRDRRFMPRIANMDVLRMVFFTFSKVN